MKTGMKLLRERWNKRLKDKSVRNHQEKPRTIFGLFIVPLIVIVLFQAAIYMGTIVMGKTPRLLDQYLISTQSQMVENRKLVLENSMVQQWSNVEEEEEAARTELRAILAENSITLEEFLGNQELKDELLARMSARCMYLLHSNETTGVYLILANQDMSLEDNECRGIYLRDADPKSNSMDYSDVLLERGSPKLSRALNIPLDSYWTTDFTFKKSMEREEDDFFYQPFEAAKTYTDAAYTDLAYWSRPFCLEGDVKKGGYRMISYSIPLRNENGEVFGVLGTEISETYLEEYMPFKELNQKSYSSYLLAEKQEDGTYQPLFGTGTVLSVSQKENPLNLEETDYKDVYRIRSEEGEELFASVSPLYLYNSNTPFASRQWVLAGIQRRQDVMGIGDTILKNLAVAVFMSIVFGIIGAFISVRHVTNPIRRLAECIRGSSRTHLKDLPYSNIMEVDRLYDVLQDLTDKQRASEYRLKEEKERYRLALQGSKDVFFSYDIENDCAEMFNLPLQTEQAADSQGMQTIEHAVKNRDWIFPEDYPKVIKELEAGRDAVHIVFRGKIFNQDGAYQWIELDGKMLRDTDQNKAKLIGSLRDIHQQRLDWEEKERFRQRDLVTGLYRRTAGEKKIRDEIDSASWGQMVLLDVDRFRELNERFGMVFGDAILEETGRMIREEKEKYEARVGKELVPVRMGGDEILLWFSRGDREECRGFVNNLEKNFEELYPEKNFELQLSGGMSEATERGKTFPKYLWEVRQALSEAKNRVGSTLVSYEEIPENQRAVLGHTDIDDIASIQYGRKINMPSTVFNFFDKSNDIHNIMPVLLVKLGRYYHAADINVVLTDEDFYASHLSYQWHESGSIDSRKVRKFTQECYQKCVERLDEDVLVFDEALPLSCDEEEFLGIRSGQRGISIAMREKGRYMGAVTYTARDEGIFWTEEELENLKRITKIIESNIQRERHDLASKAKSDFLSRMSHEIRTPMNAIIGMTEIGMKDTEHPAQVENCLAKINQSSKYLLGLINDILDMSKIESGKMKLMNKNFSMSGFLEEIRIMIQPQAEEKNLSFRIQSPEQNYWIVGDDLRLGQIVINLLGNAVKFTPKGGQVTMTVQALESQGGWQKFHFSVEDTGIGISEENLERIFDSFEQADGDTSAAYGGTGLGLAISNRLIRMMGSRIELDSEPGKGSNFYFELQLKLGREDDILKGEAEDGVQAWTSGKNLLLVEDNELNREIAATLLEEQGFTITPAVNGKEAVDCFLDEKPGTFAAILMDIRMPVMNGLEATKQIRRSDHPEAMTIPIIAMTANAFDDDMKKSIESGMSGHLTKPIDIKALVSALKKVIQKD